MATARQRPKAAPADAGDGVRIRFDGEPHHVLVVDKNTKLRGGQQATVSKERAEYLIRGDFNVTVTDGTHFPAAWPQKDAELDAIAAKVGLIWPALPAGKTSLSVEEKVAALEQAGHTPEPVE